MQCVSAANVFQKRAIHSVEIEMQHFFGGGGVFLLLLLFASQMVI